MRTTTIWVSMATLLVTCSPAGAQQFWYIPHIDEAKTPIESQLESPELSLSGLGIGSTRSQIIKRLQFATEHKWLTAAQVDQLCNDLKRITDKEASLRDASGKLSFQSRNSLAKQLSEFNQKFEEMVLVREQSNPGIEGLQAREAMMIQRVNLAVSQGKMTNKKAAQLKAEVRAAMADMPEKEITEEQTKKIATELSRISGVVEKDMHNPSMASRVVPFSR